MPLGCCDCTPTGGCVKGRSLTAIAPFGTSAAQVAVGINNTCAPIAPFDTGHSYTDSQVAGAAATSAMPYVDCTSSTRYRTVTYRYTTQRSWDGGSSTEIRWAEATWTVDYRDGRMVSIEQSSSESGTTWDWSLSDYGAVSQSGTKNAHASDVSGAYGGSKDGGSDTYSDTVTATSATFQHNWTVDGGALTYYNKTEITLGNAWSFSSAWAQAEDMLDALDVTNNSATCLAPTSAWSSGPMLNSNSSTQTLWEIVGGSYNARRIALGNVRHESAGVVLAASFITSRIPQGSLGFVGSAAQQQITDILGQWDTTETDTSTIEFAEAAASGGSPRWVQGVDSWVWSDKAVHLVHDSYITEACATATDPSDETVECDFIAAETWGAILHTDCYYSYCITRPGRYTNDCLGFMLTETSCPP